MFIENRLPWFLYLIDVFTHSTSVFDVSFGIDTLLPNEGSRRVRLYRGQGYPTVTSVNETVTVTAKNAYCKSYVAILKEVQ